MSRNHTSKTWNNGPASCEAEERGSVRGIGELEASNWPKYPRKRFALKCGRGRKGRKVKLATWSVLLVGTDQQADGRRQTTPPSLPPAARRSD